MLSKMCTKRSSEIDYRDLLDDTSFFVRNLSEIQHHFQLMFVTRTEGPYDKSFQLHNSNNRKQL